MSAADEALPLLEALTEASKALQNTPIQTLIDLATQADDIISTDPSLFHLSRSLLELKTLLQNLQTQHGQLLRRHVTNYRISKARHVIEAQLQSHLDRRKVDSFVETMNGSDESDSLKIEALVSLEIRLGLGFDKEYQEVVLKAKVFALVEFVICESTLSGLVKDQAASVALALVQFNKDVFVGLVLMGPMIGALVSLGSCRSIQVLTNMVRIIKTPLVDDIVDEIPRIVGLLGADEAKIKAAAMNCVFEIGYLAREEVIEAMLGEGLVKKLMELQRLKEEEEEEDEGVERFPFLGCVAGFAVQVEVGEGLEKSEKRAVKLEILRRVREASVSEAEAATVVSEVLWGSSP